MISSLQSQFDEYLGDLAEFLGHADRRQPFFDYCNGLLRLKAERSVTRIAAAVGEEACDYQRLHHFATEAGWSDQALLKEVAGHTLPWLKGSEKEVLAWIVSEIGIRRRGATFPLVARQPCPPNGDVCLCQVAVVLSLATTTGILPIALRLCPAPGVSRSGQNKFSIALDLVLAAVAQGIPRGTVVLDGDFGASEDLRLALAENKVSYVSKVPAETRIWVPAEVRLPPPGRKSRSDRPWREHAGKFSRSGHLTIAAFMAAQQNFLSWVPYEFMGPERIVRRSYAAVRLSRKTGRDSYDFGHPPRWLVLSAISYLTGNYWLAWSDRDAFDDALIDALHVRRDAATEVGALLKRIGVFDFRGQSERGLYHHATLCLVVYGFAVMAAEEEERFVEDMLDRLASGFGEGQ